MRTGRLVTSVFALGLACDSVAAESHLKSVEEFLGGPVIQCTGSVTWEAEGGSPTIVPYSFAVRDVPDADKIAFLKPIGHSMKKISGPVKRSFATPFAS